MNGRDFKYLREIGSGGYGAVYEAEECTSGSIFAVKRLLPELSSNKDMRQAFINEGKVAIELTRVSESVVAAYYLGDDRQGPYLVMEMIRYPNLENLVTSWTAEVRPSVHETLRLIREIGRTVALLHSHGFLHRDLKPSNLFVTKKAGKWIVKISDFGLARDTSEKTLPQLKKSVTYGYSSPEQIMGLPTSRASDVYSLGAIAYRCITLRQPSLEKLPIRHHRPDLPAFLLGILDKCMDRDPKRRPSLDDLILAIDQGIHYPNKRIVSPKESIRIPPPQRPVDPPIRKIPGSKDNESTPIQHNPQAASKQKEDIPKGQLIVANIIAGCTAIVVTVSVFVVLFDRWPEIFSRENPFQYFLSRNAIWIIGYIIFNLVKNRLIGKEDWI
jgi:serine/threonine protein kinase